ncbi:MAG: radical SAM protein [Blastocatellia bacterium AA13]|nr:MAG: radical SAM protein [Blastocatellia bacterium AA13]
MNTFTRLKLYLREYKFMAKGLFWTGHPVLAHIIPMRRCNLACAYCNEYDAVSEPVPLEVMYARLDKLADLGTTAIIISGGEPLLHPDIEKIIKRIRRHGMLACLITNGYLFTEEKIRGLNKAGLEYLQISIDNLVPDEVSKKSLKVLDKKLVWLSQLAKFRVNINSVIGGGVKSPEDALTIGNRAVELGFSTSLGIIHDGLGTLKPLKGVEREVYLKMKTLGKKGHTRFKKFQENLAEGKPNNWRCRAGARYLYICEDGLVHYCSQQRGYPGIPLEQYTPADIRREYLTKKACADYCTIACVHQVATFDNWRDPQTLGVKGAVRRESVQAIQTVYQIES